MRVVMGCSSFSLYVNGSVAYGSLRLAFGNS